MTTKKAHASVRSDSIFKPDILLDKVVFCTGANSGGICSAQVEALMRHGCHAAIFGRRAELSKTAAKEFEDKVKNGRRCLGLSGDVRKYETIVEAVKKTVEEFGRIDYLIAGAAGNFLSPIEAASPRAFETVIGIDLLGTFNTIKAALPELKKSKGSIIAISATLQEGATLLQAHAASAKAGVDTLIRHVAIEYGPFGIRANTIAPGPIEGTEGFDRLVPKENTSKVAHPASRIPTQRFGTKDDIANTTVFLCSPAGSYISGTQIVVDGGEVLMKTQNSFIQYPDALLSGQSFRPEQAKGKGSGTSKL